MVSRADAEESLSRLRSVWALEPGMLRQSSGRARGADEVGNGGSDLSGYNFRGYATAASLGTGSTTSRGYATATLSGTGSGSTTSQGYATATLSGTGSTTSRGLESANRCGVAAAEHPQEETFDGGDDAEWALLASLCSQERCL